MIFTIDPRDSVATGPDLIVINPSLQDVFRRPPNFPFPQLLKGSLLSPRMLVFHILDRENHRAHKP